MLTLFMWYSVLMLFRPQSIRSRTRRPKRGATLLIAAWTLLWLSQSWAGCCDPRGGQFHRSPNSAAAMDAVALSEHSGCNDPQGTPCPLVFDEVLPLASAQSAAAGGVDFLQLVSLPSSSPMFIVQRRPGYDRIPDSPGPPGDVYLRFQRLLI
jgi:hypothetical protein